MVIRRSFPPSHLFAHTLTRSGDAARNSRKRGLSCEQIPVIVARDRTGATIDAVLPRLDRASITGALGGVIIFLVWLWLTNVAVLLGAEFDAELGRARAIAAGLPHQAEPYLPLRDVPKQNNEHGGSGTDDASVSGDG